MAAYQIAVVALLLGLALPFVLAGNAKGAETSSQSNYNYDANGNIILSTAGNNNQNGNGKGTSADVIDWYNDQEYPTCPLKACPPFKHYCSGGMCNDTAGILGRWRCLKCGICWLYPPGTAPRCETQLDNNNGYRIKYNSSRIGGSCPYTKNDPHFQGAQGTRFEFNAAPKKTFCLLTDRNAEHKFRVVARAGKQQERGDGFLSLAEMDGEAFPRMTQPGEALSLPGGLTFTFVEIGTGGVFVKDVYRVTITGLLEMKIKLCVAHPLLQTPEDAETHIKVAFDAVEATNQVHGIMGQAYRDEGQAKRAMDYNTLAHALGRPVAADAAEGAGFLDGETADYESTSVLAADCRFSAFHGKALLLPRTQ
ncbi:unnamed protein product [Closterium sp. NIES-64]|nr:unnamed protein product [Closterium sp. NIES-64]CAI5988069.1 unnamed protein product [Closterium sp. NIES-64]